MCETNGCTKTGHQAGEVEHQSGKVLTAQAPQEESQGNDSSISEGMPPQNSAKLNIFARIFSWAPLAPVAILVGFSALAAMVLLTNPTDDVGPSTCVFKVVTGFDCPGCGGTRAFYYVLTFDFPEAARNHLMATFAAPLIIWLFVAWAWKRFTIREWKLPVLQLTPKIMTTFLITWAAYWVIRNLPWEPFTQLYV